jgi:hypothetical protein
MQHSEFCVVFCRLRHRTGATQGSPHRRRLVGAKQGLVGGWGQRTCVLHGPQGHASWTAPVRCQRQWGPLKELLGHASPPHSAGILTHSLPKCCEWLSVLLSGPCYCSVLEYFQMCGSIVSVLQTFFTLIKIACWYVGRFQNQIMAQASVAVIFYCK